MAYRTMVRRISILLHFDFIHDSGTRGVASVRERMPTAIRS